MKVVTKKWNPDRRDIVLELPIGSTLIGVRMSHTGDCQAAFSVPDRVTETEPYPMAICVENTPMSLEGGPGDWRHVGTWEYANGRVAHAFQPIEAAPSAPSDPTAKTAPTTRAPTTKRRKRKGSAPVDSLDAEQ